MTVPKKVRTAVIGAGLTGLSTAFHLENGVASNGDGRVEDCVVFEKEREPGGLCRTIRKDGFGFDYSGHLLHLRNDYTKELVARLSGSGNLRRHKRIAHIHFKDRRVPFPFQANLAALPFEIARECLLGFVEAHCDGGSARLDSFEAWTNRYLGKGLTRHFFAPYNGKLYGSKLSDMTPEWCEKFVPKPTLEETIDGALQARQRRIGYNAGFLYPNRGGIQVLVDAFSSRVGTILPDTEVKTIRWKEKALETARGTCSYERLVSTMPLPLLVDRLRPFPEELESARRSLRWRKVHCLNFGVDSPAPVESHWLYFPEPGFVFYRVGFFSNFSPDSAPSGCSSLYVEAAADPDDLFDVDELEKKVIEDMLKAGVLGGRDNIAVRCHVTIPFAYVIYNHDRPRALERIQRFLRGASILSTGRYGAWKYSSMEEAVLDGRAAAEQIKRL